ncbi:protein-tyrosine phosphatase-like protein [Phycomyces nitens]|nr:protein-tyrosine phosphatase-like protein [Phycomyces nitens]
MNLENNIKFTSYSSNAIQPSHEKHSQSHQKSNHIPKRHQFKNHKNLSLSLTLPFENTPIPPPPQIAETSRSTKVETSSAYKDNISFEDQSHDPDPYRKGPAQILPNLYLGASYNAAQYDQLNANKIICIVNVASEIKTPTSQAFDIITQKSPEALHTSQTQLSENTAKTRHNSETPLVQYHHLRWTHAQNNLAYQEFDRAIRIFETYQNEPKGNILVHCQCGIERSAALVIAYVLYLSYRPTRFHSPRSDHDYSKNLSGKRLSVPEAYEYVRERAPSIRPNLKLMYQLSDFKETLSLSSPRLPSELYLKRSGSVRARMSLANGSSAYRRPRSSSLREFHGQPKSFEITNKHIQMNTLDPKPCPKDQDSCVPESINQVQAKDDQCIGHSPAAMSPILFRRIFSIC